ncbi:MAG: lactate utilization protein [Deltaproteobacteria bacterium]|nr:lactate utilization protein [Deltaproteobacteria bacterium]MBW2067710.1 lactate utilization protein [Deltaproteobacteria bacterium]
MNDPLRKYWEIRLNRVKENLEKNNFEAYVAESAEQAKSIVVDKIILSLKPSTISFGGSVTVVQTGIYDALKRAENIEIIDTYDMSLSPKERINQRKRALLADLFITGTNAVVENGMLVNLDGMGNRIAAITFGPRHVIIVVGRNKVVFDLEEALQRVKEIAAPANAIRLNRKTPCAKTGQCEDCSSPERICNVWSIVEKSAPKGRIKVILVNDDLGF